MNRAGDDPIYRAERAAVLIEELGPFFEDLERDYYGAMFKFDRVTDDGQTRILECLRMIEAVRRLSGELKATITRGQSALLAAQKSTSRSVA